MNTGLVGKNKKYKMKDRHVQTRTTLLKTTSVYKPLAKNKSTEILELINLSTNFKRLLSTSSSTSCNPTKHRKSFTHTASLTPKIL